MTDKPLIYGFDDVRVELASFRLFKAGESVALEPKAFEALIFLIERRGRLVTKDELLDGVWKDAFVTPNALTRIVAQLRRALGEGARAARYIETVPTRGYRFIAEVEEIGARNEEKAVPEKTLAVLPFKLLNPNGETNYLSVGLADSLITRLSTVRSLTVRPTSAVLRYANESDVANAGRALRAETVIDGTIQQAGDRVRVSVRLISVADGKPLWADTYDAQFVNIFQVQDEISDRITEALEIRLHGDERARIARPPTNNFAAYQLCLRANHHLYQYMPDGLERAIELFKRAVALDANYALAYAGLSNAYGIAASFGDENAAMRAGFAAAKAVELDPALGEAHAALAVTEFWNKRQTNKAQNSFDRALELSPNSPVIHHYYSWYLIATARFDEAETHLRRALELDPLSPSINVDQGLPLFFAGRYAEARARYEQAAKLDANIFYAHLRLAEACEGAGDFARAIVGLERAAALSNGDPIVKTQLARTLALAGKRGEARRLLEELTAPDAPRGSPYYLAAAFAALGETDEAFDQLNRALAEQDKWIGWSAVDPRLDSLRRDTRFSDFLRRVNGE
jgi:TolB-like protein/Flp pilus assembly protein TadD